MFNQGDDSLNHGIVSKTASRIGLKFASGQWQRLRQLQNAFFGLRFGKPNAFCKLIPVSRLDFVIDRRYGATDDRRNGASLKR